METPKELLANLPHAPGVYLFKNALREVLYVGKAKDLKNRVSQYFQRADAIGPKTELLVSQTSSVHTVRTLSEFDALLLEATLIRRLQPKYNSVAKDDKSPLYIALSTGEVLPRVRLRRKPTDEDEGGTDTYIGPFQSAKVARDLLRALRQITPFCTQKRRDGKPCFYTHLGLCNPCPSVIARMEQGSLRQQCTSRYRKHILRLRRILRGKTPGVMRDMEKEMLTLAKREQFEEAEVLKQRIDALHRVAAKRFDPLTYLSDPFLLVRTGEAQAEALRQALTAVFHELAVLSRIECFDISNISGTSASASLVVATDGLPDPSQYRRFRVRFSAGSHDVAMLQEVLRRRFLRSRGHGRDDWLLPDLIVIDGGKPQLAAARSAVAAILSESQRVDGSAHRVIPIIALAKRREEIIAPKNAGFITLRLPLSHPGLLLLRRIRDEAHRFAHRYHTFLRSHR